MIEIILEALKVTDQGSKNIQIAKGKYELPTTIKGAYRKMKKELRWQK